jgi:hypothetical protein
MRKQLLITILAITSFIESNAQNNFNLPGSSNQIFANSSGGIGSSNVPQNFINKFIFPDFINYELKDATSKKLSDNNLCGGEVGGSLNILINRPPHSSGKFNTFFGFGFGTQIEGNLTFSKDLFDLTFFGNQPFAGQTQSLNKTSLNILSYSYFEGTLGITFIQNSGSTNIWADFGLILGSRYTTFKVGTGYLLTEKNGDYLSINLAESILEISDTANFSYPSGIGAKLDLHYAKQSDSYQFIFSIENIGGISWKNSIQAKLDTTFTFEGIEIKNIFQLSDSVLNEVASIDSFLESKTENNVKTLPVNITAYYKAYMKKYYLDVFVKHRLHTNYLPFVRLGFNYNLPIVKPGITIAYGGYSTIQAGLNADIEIGNVFKFQLGTNNILGAIVPKSSKSLDLYAGVNCKF